MKYLQPSLFNVNYLGDPNGAVTIAFCDWDRGGMATKD
jgi:hypothetical protein